MSERRQGEFRLTATGKKHIISNGEFFNVGGVNFIHGDIVSFKSKNRFAHSLKLIERKNTKIVGVFINNKVVTNSYYEDFEIDGEFDNGTKLLFEVIGNNKTLEYKLDKVLGLHGDNETEMNAIMYEFNLPVEFPQEVENESILIPEIITRKEISKRLDMRDTLTFTIDPYDAKDFDDAISYKVIDDKIEIGVHIADVAHYIKEGTELDKEAFKRGTSVYLVDRCVPMLPERLSNGICSLNPNTDKLTFSAIFEIKDNEIVSYKYTKAIINSNKRYTYEEAQEIIDGREDEYSEAILKCNEIAKSFRKKRIKNGIDINSKEVKFLLDENKKPIGIRYKTPTDATKLIEEFMLLANKYVNILLSKSDKQPISRVHSEPEEKKIDELISIYYIYGYEPSGKNIKDVINNYLRVIKDTPLENILRTLTVRSMKKASYSFDNIGHFGLGFENYSHFTSPIRRYSDIILHRQLLAHLDGTKYKISENDASHVSYRELQASRAERESIKYKQAEYLQDKIGEEFDAVITNIMKWGIVVEIEEMLAEGIVYNLVTDTYRNKVFIYGRYHNPGEAIRLRVKSVDMVERKIIFEEV